MLTSKKESTDVISRLMLLVHSSACGRMQARKASDDHLPSVIVFAVEMSLMNRAMAAPERMDLFPISLLIEPEGGFSTEGGACCSQKLEETRVGD